jgi:hypothetical protein
MPKEKTTKRATKARTEKKKKGMLPKFNQDHCRDSTDFVLKILMRPSVVCPPTCSSQMSSVRMFVMRIPASASVWFAIYSTVLDEPC